MDVAGVEALLRLQDRKANIRTLNTENSLWLFVIFLLPQERRKLYS